MKNIFLLLLFAVIPFISWSQENVSGSVQDPNGVPLPGASILIKGTTKGEITDMDGNFSIEVNEFPATLLFNFLGFSAQEKEVTGPTTLTITLEEDEQQLGEVVLIGYGEVEREDVTGAITTIKPNENAVAQSQSVQEILQGRAAGVQVQNGTSPTGASSIKIRGLSSLTSSTEPLYVVDGIIMDSASEDVNDPLSGGNSYMSPQGGISGINPRDIESIEILKDASATAIYGSRGANGVILITTKRGERGKTKINYTTTMSVGKIANKIDVLGPSQYVDYVNEWRTNKDLPPTFYTYSDGSIATYTNSEEYMIQNSDTINRLTPIDWQDDIYVSSFSQRHRISASGGGDNGDYYLAGGYFENNGVIPRTFVKQGDFVSNINFDLSEKWDLFTKVSAEYTKNSASRGTENLGGTNNSMVRQIISAAPFENYTENYYGEEGGLSEVIDGPRAWLQDYDDLSEELRILGAAKLQYEISKTFKYILNIGADYRRKERKRWYGTAIFRGAQSNGEAGIATLDRFRYNIDNTLRFKKNINKNHRLDGTVGFVLDTRNTTQSAQSASDFTNKDLRADGIKFGSTNTYLINYGREIENIASFIARVNYTLKNKYLLTATYRADGSSKFAEGNRWGHFPAVGVAWKMHKEKFLRKSKAITNAKLRLGYGITGNQRIPNYRFLAPFDNSIPYSDSENGSLTGLVQSNLANPDITWEKTAQYNAGIDIGIKDDRYTFTADVFYKDISDLLLEVRIGGSNGFETYYANQGNLINKGIELSASADIIDNGDWTWNVNANITFVRNKVGDLPQPLQPFGTQTYSGYLGNAITGGNYFKVPANIFIDGKAPGLFYGLETKGIIKNENELAQAPGFNGRAPQLGDVWLVDQNGDGNITDADRTIIGDPNPDFNYGFGTMVTYKNFSLNLFFNGVYGNDIANGNLLRTGYAEDNTNNIRTVAYENAWSTNNPNGNYPRVGYDLSDDTGFTDRIVEDASFLRLTYVTLGYDIPVEKLDFLNSAYVSVSGRNLWLLTNYSGYDPEVDSYTFDPLRVGIDRNSFPNQREVAISLNLSF